MKFPNIDQGSDSGIEIPIPICSQIKHVEKTKVGHIPTLERTDTSDSHKPYKRKLIEIRMRIELKT